MMNHVLNFQCLSMPTFYACRGAQALTSVKYILSLHIAGQKYRKACCSRSNFPHRNQSRFRGFLCPVLCSMSNSRGHLCLNVGFHSRCITFHPESECLFSGSHESFKVHLWEPHRVSDSISMGWGKIKDIAVASKQLVCEHFDMLFSL